MRPALLTLLLLTACEPALPDPGPPAVVPDGGADAGPTNIITVAEGSSFVSTIDAQNSSFWIGLDLDTGREATFEPPAWNLAFNRFHIRARGGASGDGGVVAAIIKDVTFVQVTEIPDGGFFEDQPDGPDDNTELDTVFEVPDAWYSYELQTHILTPKPWIYVVKSDDGAFFKVSVERYYDSAGTPAVLTLRFARISP
jgi:hypothetical protein